MKFNQVTLPVKDMDVAANFYLKLGFTQIVDPPHYTSFLSQMGILLFPYHSNPVNLKTVL
tara:strand:- start:3660 stop:3839 length:180 start_codon:yes stop_codon:yes gene_type:complete